MLQVAIELKLYLATVPASATDEQMVSASPTGWDRLLALNKCPDFEVNRGHYFGTAEFNRQEGLSADEKAFGTEPALSDRTSGR